MRIYCGGWNGLVEYYDTTTATWTDLTIPGQAGADIAAVISLNVLSTNDIWAGLSSAYPLSARPRIAHYDGNGWTVWDIPDLGGAMPDWYWNSRLIAFSWTEVYIACNWGPDTTAVMVKWDGSGFTKLAQQFANSQWVACLAGVDHHHIYCVGYSYWGYGKIPIWLLDGPAETLTEESQGNGIPGGGAYSYIPVLAVIDNDHVIVCPQNISDTKLYVGRLGSWSVDKDVTGSGYNDYADAGNTGDVAMCDRLTGRVHVRLGAYAGGATRRWQRSSGGIWTRESLDSLMPYSCAISGHSTAIAISGSCSIDFSDVLLSTDNGGSWTGFDRPTKDTRFAIQVLVPTATVNVSTIRHRGGDEIVLSGDLPVGTVTVCFEDQTSGRDYQGYSGCSGSGYDCVSDGTTVAVVTPPLPAGLHAISVYQDGELVAVSTITVVEDSNADPQWELRRRWPSQYFLGARTPEVE